MCSSDLFIVAGACAAAARRGITRLSRGPRLRNLAGTLNFIAARHSADAMHIDDTKEGKLVVKI